MPAKPVQISFDVELLARVDADPETRQHGRSAFVRAAIEQYLHARQRRRIERQIVSAYGTERDSLAAESAAFLDAQEWPDD